MMKLTIPPRKTPRIFTNRSKESREQNKEAESYHVQWGGRRYQGLCSIRARRGRATTDRGCDWHTCAGNLHPNLLVTIEPHLPSAAGAAPLSPAAPPRRSIFWMAFLMVMHSRSSSCTRFRMLSMSSLSIWFPLVATRHVLPSSLSPSSSPWPAAPPSFATIDHTVTLEVEKIEKEIKWHSIPEEIKRINIKHGLEP